MSQSSLPDAPDSVEAAAEELVEDAVAPPTPLPVVLPGVPKKKRLMRIPMPHPGQRAVSAMKPTRYEVAIRRQNAQRLRLRGHSTADIAKQLGVAALCIKKDLKAIAAENQSKIDQFQQSGFIGESLCLFDEVIQQCWKEFEVADPGSKLRLQSLDLIRSTQNDKLKALQDTGLLSKAAQQVEHTHSIALPWSDELKRAVEQQMLNASLTPQLAAPTPDPDHAPGGSIIIDAEIVSEDKK